MGEALDLGRESVVESAPQPGTERAAGSVPRQEKYAILGPLGRGGMGEVLLVTDRDLGRQVAMKLLRPEKAGDAENRIHFLAEAQATSQLEHPGIPPVHDLGRAADGRLYFTMKLVRGGTLRQVLTDLAGEHPGAQRAWTLHRLITVLERLCETLHFAHERGVVHRDLKPENVMLGDFGEVHLMDWGLAHVAGAPQPPPQADLRTAEGAGVHTARTEAALDTQFGDVKGTLPYMAPEQLLGTADRRTDVYALGLLLYEILTLRPAFEPRAAGLLRLVAEAAIPPIETRHPGRDLPPALVAICRRALARDPAERFPDAKSLGEALRAWLDGTSERERRHREAQAFAAKGLDAVERYERVQSALRAAEAQVERLAGAFRPWQPLAEKRPLFEARRQCDELTVGRSLAFAEALRWLEAALAQEERHPAARSALAHLWDGRLADAEARGQDAEVGYALAMLRRYDDGALAVRIRGDGTLTLDSTPTGAEVLLSRFVEEDGLLVAREARHLGTTPLRGVALPMGSYVCTLRHLGRRDVTYPIHITRGRAWEGRAHLRTEAEIGADFVLVPGGPFVYGEGRATVVRDLPDFLIARRPVTFGDWATFLTALEAEQGPEAAARLCPGTPGDGPMMERGRDGAWQVKPEMTAGPSEAALLARHGPGFGSRLPVVGISWHDAVAFAAWKTRTTGLEHRLPTEEEREKAARGVDGRRFPWGATEDASLCKCREARPEPTQPEPVGSFPTATSVYGMLDAVGGVYDWCDAWFDAREANRVNRGGGWASPIASVRCTLRAGNEPRARMSALGVRLVRSLPPA